MGRWGKVCEFKDGNINEKKGIEVADGYNYIGDWVTWKHHGTGTSEHACGEKYEGEWKNGMPNGKGTDTWKYGDKYEGESKMRSPTREREREELRRAQAAGALDNNLLASTNHFGKLRDPSRCLLESLAVAGTIPIRSLLAAKEPDQPKSKVLVFRGLSSPLTRTTH